MKVVTRKRLVEMFGHEAPYVLASWGYITSVRDPYAKGKRIAFVKHRRLPYPWQYKALRKAIFTRPLRDIKISTVLEIGDLSREFTFLIGDWGGRKLLRKYDWEPFQHVPNGIRLLDELAPYLEDLSYPDVYEEDYPVNTNDLYWEWDQNLRVPKRLRVRDIVRRIDLIAKYQTPEKQAILNQTCSSLVEALVERRPDSMIRRYHSHKHRKHVHQ